MARMQFHDFWSCCCVPSLTQLACYILVTACETLPAPKQINSLIIVLYSFSNSRGSGSSGATCNCSSGGRVCAYSNCPRCNPDCCAFGVGKHKETLEDNSGNGSSGSNNGGFGSGDRSIGSLAREVTGSETCDYTCRSDRSCSVTYSKR